MRIAQLLCPFRGGPYQRLYPIGHVIEQVVLRQRKLRHEVHRILLHHDGQAFGASLLSPGIAVLVIAHGHMQGTTAAHHHLGE